jgi:hypothetical protein
MLEEPHLPLDPTTISDEFATFSDHSMTGDDDDDTIVVIGSSDGSDGFGTRYHLRLLAVAPSFTIWDLLECFPCTSLKLGSTR